MILGQVVDARDNRPIDGAIVSLSGGPASQAPPGSFAAAPAGVPAQPSSPRRVLADSQGRFMFFALPAGMYNVSAGAPGYMNVLYGQTRPGGQSRPIVLKDDQKAGNVTVLLWRYAVLSGTVLDEAGEAAVSINVWVLRRTPSGLKSRFSQSRIVRTDDRGQYRASGLLPGEYLIAIPSSTTTIPISAIDALQFAQSARDNGVSARAIEARLSTSNAPVPSPTGTRVGNAYVQNRELSNLGPVNVQADGVWMYQTLFFPGSTTSSQATTVAVAAGEERLNLDFQLRPVPTFKVSGIVGGGDGSASNLGVRLVPANTDDFTFDTGLEAATTVTEANGAFTFMGVPPGAYTAKVLRVPQPNRTNVMLGPDGLRTVSFAASSTEPTLWAETSVAVGDADVGGVTLTLKSGARVSGRIEFDGTAPRPSLDRTPSGVTVTLSPVGPRGVSRLLSTPVNANGQFTSASMPPGRFVLTASTAGWTLRSAILGGVDISDVPVDLENTDLSGVLVTFFDRPAQVIGVVRNARGSAEEGATVFLTPANYRTHLDLGLTPGRLRTAIAGADGKYAFGGVLPGEYIAAAVNNNLPGEGTDPIRFFETVGRIGTRITVSDSEKKTQDLSIVQVQVR